MPIYGAWGGSVLCRWDGSLLRLGLDAVQWRGLYGRLSNWRGAGAAAGTAVGTGCREDMGWQYSPHGGIALFRMVLQFLPRRVSTDPQTCISLLPASRAWYGFAAKQDVSC